MDLRIFVYKITFEEIPDFYIGFHKESKENDGYLGSPITHKWKWDFYTPKLTILQTFNYNDEGLLQAQHVEESIIRYFWTDPKCLNENIGGKLSRKACQLGAKKGRENLTLEAMQRRNQKVKESWRALKTIEERRNRTGWKNLTEEERVSKAKQLAEISSQKTRKAIKVISPSGEEMIFRGVNEAAEKLGLSSGNLSMVLNGIRKHTKGFTASFICYNENSSMKDS